MANYSTHPQKFLCSGIGLSRPPNLQKPGKFPLLLNARSRTSGTLIPRGGYTQLSALPASPPIHTLRDLNDYLPGSSNPISLIVGAGTGLYSTPTGSISTTPVLRDSGYSGLPLTTVQFRPDQSPESWLYVADSLRLRKIRADGTNYQVGIAPPNLPPTTSLAAAGFDPIGNYESVGAWQVTATASGLTSVVRVPSGTTIAAILYDSPPGPGLCSIIPSSLDVGWLGLNSELYLSSSEPVSAFAVLPGSSSTTIAAIAYDTGSSGPCTIVLTISLSGVDRDTILLLGGSEYVRVLSISPSQGGNYSIRASTTSSHASGQSAQVIPSFRTSTLASYSPGATITGSALQFTNATGLGILFTSFGTPLDLSRVQGQPTKPADYIHLSIKVDDYTALSKAEVFLFASSTVGNPNAGLYRYAFHDLTLTTPRSTVNANDQWIEIRFPISAMEFFGGDANQSLASIYTVQVEFTTTASVVIDFNSWTVFGGYDLAIAPDALTGYQYRFRYRSSLTGAKSIQSPATRYQLFPNRQSIALSFLPSPDPQVDLIDYERFGGTTAGWHYVGTVPNSSPSAIDSSSDLSILVNPALETDVFQPFPVADTPQSGTCTVVGTSVIATSGSFNPSWAPGTIIVIAGIANTLYASPTSASLLQLVQSAGNLTNASWFITSPTLLGQPLGFIFGPLGGATATYSFAVGDPRNPGTLYIFRGNDMDSAPEANTVEITSPSEPLTNGVLYDQQAYVFSTERLYQLRPTPEGPNLFVPLETPVGRGLRHRWCVCVGGGFLWFLGPDGLYQTNGSTVASISDDDLYPLFQHGDTPPSAVKIADYTFQPPDLAPTNEHRLRLSYFNGWLMFDYTDTTGHIFTLNYHVATQSWWPDAYFDTVTLHYAIEGRNPNQSQLLAGTTNGQILNFNTPDPSDNGNVATTRIATPSFDNGDSRAQKLFGDYALTLISSAPIASFAYSDSYKTAQPQLTVAATAAQLEQTLADLQSGTGVLARDLGLYFVWASLLPVELQEWIPSLLVKPAQSILRASDWDNAGAVTRKYVRGFKLWADTFGETRSIQLQRDGGQNIGLPISTVLHDGEQIIPYDIPAPFTAQMMRVLPLDAHAWRLFEVFWVFDPYPDIEPSYGPIISAGYQGDKWVQGVRLTADSLGLDQQLQVLFDGAQAGPTLTVNHAGKVTKPYSWPGFVAHNLQLVGAGVGVFEAETEWIYEPMPELTPYWDCQPTTYDLIGWMHMRYGYFAYMTKTGETDLVLLSFLPDSGPPLSVSFPATNGQYVKAFYSLPPNKFKSVQPRVTGPASGVRVFLRDSEIRVRAWGDPGPYQIKNAFGDLSRLRGAII